MKAWLCPTNVLLPATVASLLGTDCAGVDPLPPGCTLYLPADSGCLREERARLEAAWRVVEARVCAAPPTFVRCLAGGACSPAEGADVETVVARLRRRGWTTVRCADLAPGRGAESPAGADEALIRVDHSYLFSRDTGLPTLEETLAHELAHTLGYAHYGARDAARGEYRWSVPARFEACVHPEAAAPASREAALAPAGELGDGVEVERARWCPPGAWAAGAAAAESGSATVALSLACRGERAPAATELPVLDGVAASALRCDDPRAGGRADLALVGVRASTSEGGVRVRQALCLPRDVVLAGRGDGLRAVPAAVAGGAPVERRCPDGSAVRGFVATGGGALRRLQVWCGPLTGGALAAEWVPLARVGAYALPPEAARAWRCDDEGAVVGLFGHLARTKDGIVRLGARCQGAARGSRGWALTEGAGGVIPALGSAAGAEDTEFDVSCPPGQVAFGVRARTTRLGAIPLRVGLLCAPPDGSAAEAWRDGGNDAATLGAESRCPAGSFVAGLSLESTLIRAGEGRSVPRVATLQALCRALPARGEGRAPGG